jgi:hypothetical protein
MNPKDLDRIRFITRHFRDLQGLSLWVPFGLILIGHGFSGIFDPVSGILPVAVLSALCLMTGAGVYYRKTFGEVEQRPPSLSERSSPWLLVGTLLWAGPLLLIPSYIPLPPAQSGYVIWSSLLLGFWVLKGRSWLRGYYPALGVLLLGFAALGAPSAHVLPAFARPGIADILCGASLTVAGLLDHRQLVATLAAGQN